MLWNVYDYIELLSASGPTLHISQLQMLIPEEYFIITLHTRCYLMILLRFEYECPQFCFLLMLLSTWELHSTGLRHSEEWWFCTAACFVITHKSAILRYFAAEVWNHAQYTFLSTCVLKTFHSYFSDMRLVCRVWRCPVVTQSKGTLWKLVAS